MLARINVSLATILKYNIFYKNWEKADSWSLFQISYYTCSMLLGDAPHLFSAIMLTLQGALHFQLTVNISEKLR